VTADTLPHALSTADVTAVAARLVDNVSEVVRGQETAVRHLAAAFLSGGHVLIEDAPGSGKTTLAHAFARSVAADFRRVQGAPDLLPSDVTGSSVWNQVSQSFTFVPGPVFSHVLLVDELNRTPPRTQAAFLEAMEEGTVTVDGVSHPLPAPFTVIATQNPLEQHGAYPLPEGQLDRFALRVVLEPLSEADELRVLREQVHHATVTDLPPVIDVATWSAACSAVRSVYVAPAVSAYALALVRATRRHPQVTHGASSRAAISLVRTAQAWAVVSGREYVVPEDLQALAGPALGHRIVAAGGSAAGAATWSAGSASAGAVADILARTPVPLGG
jgi:MoxR-like ATPase